MKQLAGHVLCHNLNESKKGKHRSDLIRIQGKRVFKVRTENVVDQRKNERNEHNFQHVDKNQRFANQCQHVDRPVFVDCERAGYKRL